MDSMLFLYLTGEGTDCVQGAEISHRAGNLAARIGILLLAGKFTDCVSAISRLLLAVRPMSLVTGGEGIPFFTQGQAKPVGGPCRSGDDAAQQSSVQAQ